MRIIQLCLSISVLSLFVGIFVVVSDGASFFSNFILPGIAKVGESPAVGSANRFEVGCRTVTGNSGIATAWAGDVRTHQAAIVALAEIAIVQIENFIVGFREVERYK